MNASRRSALALIAWLAAWPLCAADVPQLAGRALGDALRHGGYVLYFRHASTDFGQSDDAMTSFDDCSQQRNLTEAGRAEARAIGAGVARAKIPVGSVLASPYCRTRETAQLVFGRATVANAVRGGPANAEAHRYDELRVLLSTAPPAGSNIAIVSHGNPFRAVVDGPYLAEGEAAVVQPLGAQGFRVVARIKPDGWSALGP